MKPTDRILIHLTIIGAVGLVGAAVVVGGFFYRELRPSFESGRAGGAFGATHSWPECVKEAIQRTGGASSNRALAAQQSFLRACLGSTTYPAGACATVPGLYEPSADWARDLCADAGTPSPFNCQGMLTVLQGTCAVLEGDGGL